mgnify:CR=1 FL=1
MLNEIYLDQTCCDELGISYSSPEKEDIVILKPSVALLLRPDWDKHHRSTFHEFIFADRELRLSPVFVKFNGQHGYFYQPGEFHLPGRYKILNPPNTRHFVKVDVDTELLRKQRDLLLEICDGVGLPNSRLLGMEVYVLSGLVNMLDEMLDQAEK